MGLFRNLKNILPVLFCLAVCLCKGQVLENWTKGSKYHTFITIKKSEIRAIIADNKYREWETTLVLDSDSMIIRVIEPVLVAWGENGDEIDTLNVINHTLYFDSASVCVRDVKRYLSSKDPDHEAFFATRNLMWKWKRTSAPGLYVTVYRFHISMKIQQSIQQPRLVLLYRLHPGWTKEEYNKFFSK
jgi:hypothetical protein